MADLTQGAVASLLGLLTTAVKNEADLQRGVERDMQFIKDEMDSMSGFLLHLTRSGNDHDDQQRAWMKQVRDIAYASQDCIELYNLYGMTPPCNSFSSVVDFLQNYVRGKIERHKLAKQLKQLKERVKDVGERRQRYGVTVPPTEAKKRSDAGSGAGDDLETKKKERQEFDEALREEEEAFSDEKREDEAPGLSSPSTYISNMVRRWIPRPPFEQAIRKLAPELAPHARKIRGALLKHKAGGMRKKHDDRRFCMEMVLRALHAFPQSRVGNEEEEELNKLMEALHSAADLPKLVMTFCYSELTTEQKSCLQYLTAFQHETSISRTSLVRRVAAERLVKEDNEERRLTIEQSAESCFEELLFRGFISADATGAAGKVKSCRFRSESVKQFIVDMCKAENFVGGGLPVHLRVQNEIRSVALEGKPQKQQRDDPVSKMLRELDSLPKSYRLNVMDLGGSMGKLKKSHLASICKIRALKYLSLRYTDVRGLPSQLQELRLLETLDIRQTNIPRGSRRNSQTLLPRSLKHLLAGNVDSQGDAPNATVRMPESIQEMRDLEILAHVKICRRRELRKVENLPKLRKLGVVFVPGNEDGMMKDLIRAVGRLSGCLHSLSVRMEGAPLNGWLDDEMSSSPVPSNLVSLRIDGLRTSGLPTWVQRLYKLQKITLCNTTLTDEKLGALSELPALVCLRLRHKSYNGRELAFRKPGGFPSLKFLRIEDVLVVTELSFQPGSMPKLEVIVWSSADHTNDDALVAAITVSVAGVENLPNLKKVVLKGLREQHPSTLTKDIVKHPNRPIFSPHGH